jgi:ATP-binding cassette subfamily B protein
MVGLVLQDSYLFPGPILENIRIYDDSVDEERVRRALELVQATDFVEALPEGLHTELRERGSNISSGEKQLLSFARALAVDPRIVVLDEATASVDAKTENRIRKAMSGMLAGRTSIVVAHRLSSILGAEQILYFEKGKILARGTHASLMAECPEYARLVRLQFPDPEAGTASGGVA